MTIIKFRRKSYALLEDAYFETNYLTKWYQARAYCLDDIADEEGFQPLYLIKWHIKQRGYNSETMLEAMACNWERPESVKEIGEYNKEKDLKV